MDNNIALKSEKVRNIVGKTPPILLRLGTGIITLVIIIICLMLYYIPYKQQVVFPIQVHYNSTYNYYVAVETSITKGRFLKEGLNANIMIERLDGNYHLEGELKQITENNGNVCVIIAITNPLQHIIHLNTSPCGIAKITISEEPLLKRILK